MKSPLAYIGGKSKLAPTIISHIPEHKTYCEVFSGAAWVFFSKDESQYEVINDLDSDLISFYRVIKNHPDEFHNQFRYSLCSRETFEDYKTQMNSKGLTDIQRAARYYYLQRLCFAGKVRGRTYGTAAERPPRINFFTLGEDITELYIRLQRVTIENLTHEQCIKKYDKPGTFFYCDPPYYDKPCYEHNFKHEDFENLSTQLSTIQGKFLLSLNDCPPVREIFKGFNFKEVSLNYSAGRTKQVQAKELLISNYEF